MKNLDIAKTDPMQFFITKNCLPAGCSCIEATADRNDSLFVCFSASAGPTPAAYPNTETWPAVQDLANIRSNHAIVHAVVG